MVGQAFLCDRPHPIFFLPTVYSVYILYLADIHTISRRIPSRRQRIRCRPRDAPAGRKKGPHLEIIISNSSDKPIYEQITSQIKGLILSGDLADGEQLPSIRALANSLRVSAITTKRAYADLEAAGFIETVQGKGSFVAGGNKELIREEQLRGVESLLAQAVERGRVAGLTPQELREMLDLVMEDA